MSSPTSPQHQYRRGDPHHGPTGRELLDDNLRRRADELGLAVNVIGQPVLTLLILRPFGGVFDDSLGLLPVDQIGSGWSCRVADAAPLQSVRLGHDYSCPKASRRNALVAFG